MTRYSPICQRMFAFFAFIALTFVGVIVPGTIIIRPAYATTVAVTSGDDSGVGTLRNAIAAASNGDVIMFNLPLPYKITLTTAELMIDKSITIDGSNHGNPVIVDGNKKYGVFTIDSNATVVLQNLTIQNGSVRFQGGRGGGVFNSGTLTISDSTISSNSGYSSGGGVFNDGSGVLTITRTAILGNSAEDGGGVFNSHNGTLTISRSLIFGNSAFNGSGVNNQGVLLISGSTIADNSAGGSGSMFNGAGGTLTIDYSRLSGNIADGGGGVFNSKAATLVIDHSTLSRNMSKRNGGGVENAGDATLHDSQLYSNFANANGGGVSNFGGGTLTISDSLLSGNAALEGGGAANDGTLQVIRSTFSGNAAGAGGGGLNNQGGTLSIMDSTVSGNSSDTTGGGLNNYSIATIDNSTFFGNDALAAGGGIYSDFATLTIRSSTLFGNNAEGDGGGIFNDGTLNITSTIIAKNSGYTPDIRDLGPINSLGYNLIGDGTSTSGFIASDQVGTKAAPIDPNLGALELSGSTTATLAILSARSPAYGKGNCTGGIDGLQIMTDQRDYARKSPNCDIGAFELHLPSSAPTGTPGSVK